MESVKIDGLSTALWLLIIFCQLVIVAFMFRKRTWQSWTAVFVFFFWSTIKSLVLLCLYCTHHWVAYFRLWWTAAFIAAALQGWVFYSILGYLTNGLLRAYIRKIFIGLMTIASLVGWGLSSHLASPFSRAYNTLAIVDRSIYLSWCIAFIALITLTGVIGVLWRTECLYIAAGFASHISAEAAWSWLVSIQSLQHWKALSDCHDAIYLLSLGFWLAAIVKSGPRPFLDSRLIDALSDSLTLLESRLKAPSENSSCI